MGTLVKVSHKRLKDILVSKVKKLGPAFSISNLGKFLPFDNFFLDLADFQDLNNFWPFNFSDFLTSSILSPLN